jgi:hypothetical protein
VTQAVHGHFIGISKQIDHFFHEVKDDASSIFPYISQGLQ